MKDGDQTFPSNSSVGLVRKSPLSPVRGNAWCCRLSVITDILNPLEAAIVQLQPALEERQHPQPWPASRPTFLSYIVTIIWPARCPNILCCKISPVFFFLTFYPSCIWEVKCFWQWQRKAATLSSRCILILRLWQPWQYNSWLYSGITAFCRKRSVGKNLLEHVFEGYRSNGPKRQTNWCFK